MRSSILALILGAAWIGASNAALAQGGSIGKELYDGNCAACHGVSGRGDGEMSGVMTIPAPDLTLLKQKNGGVFPTDKLISIVDGRTELRGHGGAMPIFAGTFGRALVAENTSSETELMIRGRILSIVLYLETLQR